MGSTASPQGGRPQLMQPKVVMLPCWTGCWSMGLTVRLFSSGALLTLQKVATSRCWGDSKDTGYQSNSLEIAVKMRLKRVYPGARFAPERGTRAGA
jgi:hypothetical protein